ncbi:apolipoprotein N-acyltransferase [Mycobacterium xenopi 3993]|nr:apolipoprotein N-acyltransferase [Mycobacterium xenopi 3993]
MWLTSFLLVAVNTAIVGVLMCRCLPGRLGCVVIAVVCAGSAGVVPVGASPGREDGSGGAGAARVIDDGAAREAAGKALTATLAGHGVDLVVWGESSVAVDPASHPDDMRQLADLARRVGADLLVNVDAPAPTGGIYKSSVLIGPDGPVGAYRKTRLVPFGEYVPLRPLVGWLTRHTKAASQDRAGAGPQVLRAGSLTIGPLISFEAVFPDLPRREVQLGAQLLAYQSSTSTFQGTWAQPQLASVVAVRAAEVGHPAVHAGLSGDSAAFDARGRTLSWRGSTYRGVLVVDVPLGSRATVYQRLGKWVLALAFSVVGTASILALRSRRRPDYG